MASGGDGLPRRSNWFSLQCNRRTVEVAGLWKTFQPPALFPTGLGKRCFHPPTCVSHSLPQSLRRLEGEDSYQPTTRYKEGGEDREDLPYCASSSAGARRALPESWTPGASMHAVTDYRRTVMVPCIPSRLADTGCASRRARRDPTPHLSSPHPRPPPRPGGRNAVEAVLPSPSWRSYLEGPQPGATP
jgi:hypothetical protein